MFANKGIKLRSFTCLLIWSLYLLSCADGRSYKNDRPYKVYKPKENEENEARSNNGEVNLARNNNTVSTDELLKSYRESVQSQSVQRGENDQRKIIFSSFQNRRPNLMYSLVEKKEQSPSRFTQFWGRLKKVIGFDPTLLLLLIAEIIVGLCILHYEGWFKKNEEWIKRAAERSHSTHSNSSSQGHSHINHVWTRAESGHSSRRLSSLSAPAHLNSTTDTIIDMESPSISSQCPCSIEALDPGHCIGMGMGIGMGIGIGLGLPSLGESTHLNLNEVLSTRDHPPPYHELNPESKPPSFDTATTTGVEESNNTLSIPVVNDDTTVKA